MEITTRDQIQLHMILFRVVVAGDRSTWINKIVVKSLPEKKYYGDNEFFMWAMNVTVDDKHDREESITDMGIEQTPRYNLHATFSTHLEALDYEHKVGIEYDAEDKDFIEFGGTLYSLDDNVDPNEMIPFEFPMTDDQFPVTDAAMIEGISWLETLEDCAEENLQDAQEHQKTSTDNKAYEDAMKFID